MVGSEWRDGGRRVAHGVERRLGNSSEQLPAREVERRGEKRGATLHTLRWSSGVACGEQRAARRRIDGGASEREGEGHEREREVAGARRGLAPL
jgi:hypothetical protein